MATSKDPSVPAAAVQATAVAGDVALAVQGLSKAFG